MAEDWDAAADALRTRREALGWGVHRLATEAGVSAETVRNIERGRGDKSRSTTLFSIAHALGWPHTALTDIANGTHPKDIPVSPILQADDRERQFLITGIAALAQELPRSALEKLSAYAAGLHAAYDD